MRVSHAFKYVISFFAILLSASSNGAIINSGATQDGLQYINIDGPIEPGDSVRFHDFVFNYNKINKPIVFVSLNSPGGSIYEGNSIIRDILNYGIMTVVVDGAQCASACFGIFASGKQRFSTPGSFIGVHRASVYGSDSDMARGHSIDMLKLYEQLNIPDDIQLAMIKTPPSSIYWINERQKKEISTLLPSRSEAKKTVDDAGIPAINSDASKSQRKLARDLNSQGIVLIRNNQYAQAINVLERSKLIYPTDAEVLGNLGYAYYMNGDHQNAKYNLTSSLNISPKRGSTWNNLGLVLVDLGELDWATDCFIKYWNYSSNKKAATNQFFYWERQRPGTLLDTASKRARAALGITSEVY